MKKCALIICVFFALIIVGKSQNALIEGYVFEDGSPNYLAEVELSIFDDSSGHKLTTVSSEIDGYFRFEVNQNSSYHILARQKYFKEEKISLKVTDESKTFMRIGMGRLEGYLMTIQVEEYREKRSSSIKALLGASVSVFNNNDGMLTYENRSLGGSLFSTPIISNNHYTITIQKQGYLIRQIEVYVEKDGCVLCFEGIDKVQLVPKDSLRQGLSKGVLVANVALLPAKVGQALELKRVRFSKGETALSNQSIASLSDIASFLKSNPKIKFELAAYTDSRGKASVNLKETFEQAKNIQTFLVKSLGVDERQITSKGYGSTAIVNKCKKGVKCSEVEHLENQRVLLRVLETEELDISNLEEKKMDTEEDLEKEVVEAVDSETIKNIVDLADRLSENNKAEASSQTSDSTMITKVKVDPIDFNSKRETIIEIIRLAELLKMDKDGTISKALDLIAMDTMDIMIEKSMKVDSKRDLDKETIVESIDNNSSKDKKEIQVIKSEAVIDEVSLFYNFSGYAIVIYFSNFPISANHEIYERYSDVRPFKTREGNILYLTGKFDNLNLASEALTKINKTDSSAYIVRFLNGKKIQIKE